MKHRANVCAIAVAAVAMLGMLTLTRDAVAQGRLRATPFVFIGTAAECGVAGSHIVTAAWLGGMGLPDNGGLNTTVLDVAVNVNENDPHRGLLLSKNGPTPDCSSAGATIKGLRPTTTVTMTTTISDEPAPSVETPAAQRPESSCTCARR